MFNPTHIKQSHLLPKHSPHRRHRTVLSWWGLLSAGGAIACLATLLGFWGRLGWFLDLFSHFRVQYFFGLLVLAALHLIRRQRRLAGCFIVFAFINLAEILPLYLGAETPPPDHPVALRLMSINVNRSSGQPALVMRAVRDNNPDVLVLEEINERWLTDLGDLLKTYPSSCIRPRPDNFGIGLFSKIPLTDFHVFEIGDAEVPSIRATITNGTSTLTIIATHPLPPAGGSYARWRDMQLEGIPEHLPRGGRPVVLIGDLNATPWCYPFKRLLKRTGLRNSLKGRGLQPSWPTRLPFLLIPIDHCLHSAEVTILRRAIGQDVGSDHYPLLVELALKTE